MKKILYSIITCLVVFSLNANAGVFGETKFCGKSLDKCKKGDLIYVPAKFTPLYCDLDQKIVATGGHVTCFYLGKKRDIR